VLGHVEEKEGDALPRQLRRRLGVHPRRRRRRTSPRYSRSMWWVGAHRGSVESAAAGERVARRTAPGIVAG
jgi:hypothetical protein